jgi:hypothetical protein
MLAADLDLDHNFVDPEDANADGTLSAKDAVAVVNALNLQAVAGRPAPAGCFLDVDGDGNLTTADPLLIINRLNRSSGAIVGSGAPLANRITQLREAILSEDLPEHVSLERATEILATLENGGRPELGECFRDGLMWFEDAVGVDIDAIREQIGDLREAFHNGETPVQDWLAAFREQHGDGQIAEELRQWLESVDAEAGALLDHIAEVWDDDQCAEVRAEIDQWLEANGVDTAAIEEHLESIRTRIENGETPIRDWLDELIENHGEEPLDDTIRLWLEEAGIDPEQLMTRIGQLRESEDCAAVREQIGQWLETEGFNVDEIGAALAGLEDRIGDIIDGLEGTIGDIGSLVGGIVDGFRERLGPA